MATLAGIASNDSNFSILVATLGFIDANLDGSDLVGTLDSADADLTVFAPTNAAFGQLAVDLGFAGDPSDEGAVTAFLTQNVPVETLNTVILYHVSAGTQTAADIDAADHVVTLQGGVIGATELPTLADAEPDLIDPSLVATDIPADNGILHVIDRVLLPVDLPGNDAPSITDLVAASGGTFDNDATDFDLLLNAVQAAGLGDTLADTGLDLTVFAPNDAAFVSLAESLGFQGDDEGAAFEYLVEALTLLGGGDPIPLLTEVLTYHVAGESLQASQVLGAETIQTLQGGTITVDGTTLVDQDPDLPDPALIAIDIQAANGVVHVIDEVLIPADLLAGDGSGDVDFIIADDRSNFIRTGRDTDFIDGNGGADLIRAGSGDDIVFGGDGADAIFAGRGDDVVSGDAGFDFIRGGRGNDHLSGGAGADIIRGGSGNDTIDGGTGWDLLSGGRGSDTFVFGEDSGRDLVTGFSTKRDVIDLTALDTDFDALHISGSGHITFLNLGGGNIVTLAGVDRHDLTEDNFLF